MQLSQIIKTRCFFVVWHMISFKQTWLSFIQRIIEFQLFGRNTSSYHLKQKLDLIYAISYKYGF